MTAVDADRERDADTRGSATGSRINRMVCDRWDAD
jgi:hypothetical protein